MRVIDGDTIVVRVDRTERRIRYIGIDTPEREECYFREATLANVRLLASAPLRLEKDVSETDRFGRLLRYVWAGERFINAELVRQGYASVFTYPPDVRYAAHFLSMQRDAREQVRGLWRPGVCE